MADVLCGAEILDDVVQVAVVTIRGIAAFGAGEGDSGHNGGTALGEVEENAQKSEVGVVVGRLGGGSESLGRGG